MAKKPVNTLFSFRCPTCGECVGLKSAYEHIKYKSDFCPRCACKLDWSAIDGTSTEHTRDEKPLSAP